MKEFFGAITFTDSVDLSRIPDEDDEYVLGSNHVIWSEEIGVSSDGETTSEHIHNGALFVDGILIIFSSYASVAYSIKHAVEREQLFQETSGEIDLDVPNIIKHSYAQDYNEDTGEWEKIPGRSPVGVRCEVNGRKYAISNSYTTNLDEFGAQVSALTEGTTAEQFVEDLSQVLRRSTAS